MRAHASEWEHYERLHATRLQATPGLRPWGGAASNGPRQIGAVVVTTISGASAYSGGAYPAGGIQQPHDWQMGWNDERHPKIKVVMQGYLAQTNGRVHLAEILTAAGRRQTDLPTLPKYFHATGQPFLCWTSVLGRCTYRDCRFCKEGGHPLPADITNEFADQVIDVIGNGIVKPTAPMGSGSPPKKQKVGDAAAQT
jgi:hypothetical protein